MTQDTDEQTSDPAGATRAPSTSSGSNPTRTVSIVRGMTQLASEAVVGTTDLVQSVQETIIRQVPGLGRTSSGPVRKIAGWVFQSIRGVSGAVDTSLQSVLKRVEAVAPTHRRSSARREAAIAALNGVLGDHLVTTGNPLALPMSIRKQGRVFKPDTDTEQEFVPSTATPERLVVLVHGLCLNDRHWTRNDHNHGAALARDLGYTPFYLRYNSGRSIPTNGRLFAKHLDALIQSWPVPVRELSIVGHSMGGLVARSAWYYGRRAHHSWCERLTTMVCLGSPHLGAPYERIGSQVDQLLEATPYTAPFADIGTRRSAGIKDLRYGRVRDTGASPARTSVRPDERESLPPSKHCLLVAGTVGDDTQVGSWIPGEGLVPVNSALGQKADGTPVLPVPESQKVVCSGANHFDLLSSPEVYQHLARWLRPGSVSSR